MPTEKSSLTFVRLWATANAVLGTLHHVLLVPATIFAVLDFLVVPAASLAMVVAAAAFACFRVHERFAGEGRGGEGEGEERAEDRGEEHG